MQTAQPARPDGRRSRAQLISAASRPAAPAVSQSLRPKAAAQLLGVGIATLWRWSARPDFPHCRRLSARCTVFDRDELLAWRDAQGGK